MMKRYSISIVIITILAFPCLGLTQTEPLPVGETFWQKPWQDVLTAWKIIFNWVKGFWNSYFSNWLSFIWEKLVSILGKEVEQRKPEIEQEFRKETEEIKQDIPETTKSIKSLWQRLKELIQ